jgi:hypothetical protein
MKSILYMNNEEFPRQVFKDLVSKKDTNPITCSIENLFYHISFDKTLEENDKPSLELLEENFKKLCTPLGVRVTPDQINDNLLKDVIRSYIDKDLVKKIDVMVLNDVANLYKPQRIKYFEMFKNNELSHESYKKIEEVLNEKTFKTVEDSIGLTCIVRSIGYDKPLIINNDIDFFKGYNLNDSFYNAGADFVTNSENSFGDIDNFLEIIDNLIINKSGKKTNLDN